MGKGAMYGVMGLSMMGIGSKTKLMELVIISGLTEEHSKDNGRTTICMAKVFTHGRTAVNMTVSI